MSQANRLTKHIHVVAFQSVSIIVVTYYSITPHVYTTVELC